jgi:hypothetical protein
MDATLWAAIVAAGATVGGIGLSRATDRRERRAKIYADALAALRRWSEVPYAILRRPASDAETRAALGKEISDSVSAVAYHVSLLRLESKPLGEAYSLLWRQLRTNRSPDCALAWALPVIASDADMAASPPFQRDDADPEWELCLLAMRRELALWSRMTHRDTMRRVEERIGARGNQLPEIPIR